MSLIDDNFLLTTDFGKKLFFDYAKDMPIIDFHCHLVPREIYENKNYQNITRLWINEGTYGDHYKWRLERANGVPEKLITGDGDDYDKFIAWADTIEHSVGNPVYEWTHLELRRFFGIDEPLTKKSAPAIWKKVNALLQTDDFKPRNLIKYSNVQAVCTTDDPADDLHYHKLLKQSERQNGFRVLPAMRPDNLIYIEKPGYGQYLQKLGQVAGIKINSFADIIKAMDKRFAYFNQMGSRLSDHSLSTYHFIEASNDEMDQIVEKGVNNETLTPKEHDQYLTMLVENLMKLNKKYGWTMQFHNNVLRNINHPMFKKIGPDTGYDAMGTQPDMAAQMAKLFTAMNDQDGLPKIIMLFT